MAALVMMAAFTSACTHGTPTPDASSAVATPGAADVVQVRTSRVDFRVQFTVHGSIQDSAAVRLLIRRNLIFEPSEAAAAGTAMAMGQVVGATTIDPVAQDAFGASGGTDRLNSAALSLLSNLAGPVQAPVAGVLKGDDAGPFIATPGYDAVAPLTPIQLLRIEAASFSGTAVVETAVGSKQVKCQSLWVDAAPAGDGQAAASGTGPVLHCRIPQEIETAPGLDAVVHLTTEPLPDAVVVPDVYLDMDRDGLGYSVIVQDGANERRYPVTTGLTDGVRRVIYGDVPPGAVLVLPQDAASSAGE